MLSYEDAEAYVESLRSDQSLAVISAQMAGEVFGIGRAAVAQQLKKGALEAIKIGRSSWVRVTSVHARLDAQKAREQKVLKHLLMVAKSGETTSFAPLIKLLGMQSNAPYDKTQMKGILESISRDTWKKHGFVLSALVNRDTVNPKLNRTPPESFFELAEELKGPVKDRAKFLDDQLRRIWMHYPD